MLLRAVTVRTSAVTFTSCIAMRHSTHFFESALSEDEPSTVFALASATRTKRCKSVTSAMLAQGTCVQQVYELLGEVKHAAKSGMQLVITVDQPFKYLMSTYIRSPLGFSVVSEPAETTLNLPGATHSSSACVVL